MEMYETSSFNTALVSVLSRLFDKGLDFKIFIQPLPLKTSMASAAVRSKMVILLLFVNCLILLPSYVFFFVWSRFYEYFIIFALSSLAII